MTEDTDIKKKNKQTCTNFTQRAKNGIGKLHGKLREQKMVEKNVSHPGKLKMGNLESR